MNLRRKSPADCTITFELGRQRIACVFPGWFKSKTQYPWSTSFRTLWKQRKEELSSCLRLDVWDENFSSPTTFHELNNLRTTGPASPHIVFNFMLMARLKKAVMLLRIPFCLSRSKMWLYENEKNLHCYLLFRHTGFTRDACANKK